MRFIEIFMLHLSVTCNCGRLRLRCKYSTQTVIRLMHLLNYLTNVLWINFHNGAHYQIKSGLDSFKASRGVQVFPIMTWSDDVSRWGWSWRRCFIFLEAERGSWGWRTFERWLKPSVISMQHSHTRKLKQTNHSSFIVHHVRTGFMNNHNQVNFTTAKTDIAMNIST